MQLRTTRVLITGAAKRLGRHMALALAQAGCNVAVHYHRSQTEALATCAQIESLGRHAVAIQADLADRSTPERIMASAVSGLGGIDILVNSASLFRRGDLRQTSVDDWDETLAVNLRAPFFLCRAFAAQIGERPGHIVNIADWRAERPGVNFVAYQISKAGLLTLTQSLAQSLGPNVQVNAIAPGAILPAGAQDEAWFRSLQARLPLRRTGSPTDITEALLYLLRSDFVTGEVLHITGGEHL